MTVTEPSLGELHYAAFLELLADVDDLPVLDGEPLRTPGVGSKYAIAYPDPGFRESDRITAVSSLFSQVVQVTGVGTDRWQAQWVCDRVAAAVDAKVLTVPGRLCWPIAQILSKPIVPDPDDEAAPVCFGVLQYRIRSTPAPPTT